MKLVLGILFASTSLFAAPVYQCAVNGVTTSCDSSAIGNYAYLVQDPANDWYSASGNTISGQQIFRILLQDTSSVPNNLSFSLKDSATINLPTATTGDYYLIEAGWGTTILPYYTLTADASSGYDFFDVYPYQQCSYGRNSYCTVRDPGVKVSADQVKSFYYSMQVAGSLNAGDDSDDSYGEVAAAVDFTVERFHADGTPDDFVATPEPGGIALSLCGMAGLALLRRKLA